MIAKDLRSGVEALGDMIAEASSIVPFTGAGISTECGIPDFRSPGGIWTRNRPIPFDEFVASQEPATRRGGGALRWSRRLPRPSPGAGIARWPRSTGPARSPAIITQNIDNLHQASGFAADDVIELHGNTTYARCIGCGKAYELSWVKQRFDEERQRAGLHRVR